MPNKITGANAGGARQLPMRTHRAARVAQFRCWGRRKVAQMILHKFQLVVLGCLVVVIAGWIILSPPGKGTGNDQRLSRMVRTENWGWRLLCVENRLPSPVVRLFHVDALRDRYKCEAQVINEDFLVSGYLTKALITLNKLPITPTNPASCWTEARRRLNAGVRIDFCRLIAWETNQVLVECRTRDLALVRTAIENP